MESHFDTFSVSCVSASAVKDGELPPSFQSPQTQEHISAFRMWINVLLHVVIAGL